MIFRIICLLHIRYSQISTFGNDLLYMAVWDADTKVASLSSIQNVNYYFIPPELIECSPLYCFYRIIYTSFFFPASVIPPSFTERLYDISIKEGEPVKLTVRVAGHPTPEVTWYREGSQIISSPDFEIVQEGDIHSLYIPEVFYEDAGKFTVQAKNIGGQAETSANLNVTGMNHSFAMIYLYEPHQEKRCLWGLLPVKTQTGLLN